MVMLVYEERVSTDRRGEKHHGASFSLTFIFLFRQTCLNHFYRATQNLAPPGVSSVFNFGQMFFQGTLI